MKVLQTVSCGIVSLSLVFTTAVLAQEQAKDEAPAAPSRPAVQEQANPPASSQTAIPLTTSKPT